MNKITTQKERVLDYLKSKGITKNRFYVQTGVANGTLDKKSGITGDTIMKIYATYPDINLDWLIAGQGQMLKSSTFTLQNSTAGIREQYMAVTSTSGDNIPEEALIKSDIPLEYVPIFAYREAYCCEGYLSLPKLGTCDGAGYVKTDSMYPLIKPGDLVCYKTANNGEAFHWGKMYALCIVIDGEEYLTIKNVSKSELGKDYVHLTGHNTMHLPKDIPVKDIRWKAFIKAYVSYSALM